MQSEKDMAARISELEKQVFSLSKTVYALVQVSLDAYKAVNSSENLTSEQRKELSEMLESLGKAVSSLPDMKSSGGDRG